MKGVIYARYSSDNQKETSIEDQLRDCQRFAEDNEIEIIGVYADRAKTGRNDNRAEFQRMLMDSDRRNFDVVIVWKLDRFARNRYDSAINKARLKRNGVRVLSAMERISDTPEGVLLESLLEGIAEYYSMDLRDKTSRGIMGRALKCKHTGGRPALGYRVTPEKDYEIDEPAAQIVRLIFDMYGSGSSYNDILAELKKRGAKTTRGTDFGTNSLHDILCNERYIGVYVFGRTHRSDNGRNNHANDENALRIEGGIPAIVTQEQWDMVQLRLKQNKRTGGKFKAKHEYLLTGKIFCGLCGGAMVGNSASRGTYYECSTRKRKRTCEKKANRQDVIEQLVLSRTLAMLTDQNIAEISVRTAALSREELASSTERTAILASLSDVDARIHNISEAIAQGIITQTTKQMLHDAETERAALQQRLHELERMNGLDPVTEEQVTFWLEHFRDMDIDDPECRRSIIDSLVNSVTVYDDKLIILYNSKGKQETVRLDSTAFPLAAPMNPNTELIFISPVLFGICVQL